MRCDFLTLVVLALVVPCPAVRLQLKDQPELTAASTVGRALGADAGSSTKFLFLTHHKSGTNLMQRLCNVSALTLSNGTEQCHWCFKVLGRLPNGSLHCPTDYWVGHGPHRGSIGRFTLISAIDSREFKLVQAWAPNYRAVHMVRDPVDMIVSDYLYNEKLIKTKSQMIWDATLNKDALVNGELPMDEAIRNVSYIRSHWVKEMCSLQEATKDDPNMVEMDLGLFKSDYPQAVQRLFSFLFGEGHARMADLLRNVSQFDLALHPELRKSTLNYPEKKPAVEARVRKLMEAGDRNVKAAASCRGAVEAAHWAGHVEHVGAAVPIPGR